MNNSKNSDGISRERIEGYPDKNHSTKTISAIVFCMLLAYSAGLWWIAYKNSKYQADALNIYKGDMIDLAKNLESLRQENIAQIGIISNRFDSMSENIDDFERVILDGGFLPYSDFNEVIETPIDDLIIDSIDATIDPGIRDVLMIPSKPIINDE